MFNNDLAARIRAIYKQGSPNSKITERICINYFQNLRRLPKTTNFLSLISLIQLTNIGCLCAERVRPIVALFVQSFIHVHLTAIMLNVKSEKIKMKKPNSGEANFKWIFSTKSDKKRICVLLHSLHLAVCVQHTLGSINSEITERMNNFDRVTYFPRQDVFFCISILYQFIDSSDQYHCTLMC